MPPVALDPATVAQAKQALFASLDQNKDGVLTFREFARVDAEDAAMAFYRSEIAKVFATGSFFLGQQKVMPQAVQGSPVLILLAVAPLALMIFWLFYVRRSGRFGTRAPSRRAAPAT